MKDFIFVAALAASTPALADEDAALKATAEKLGHVYDDAFNKHDIETMAAMFAPDAMMQFPDGRIASVNDMRAIWPKEFAAGMQINGVVTGAHRFENTGVEYGTMTITYAGKDVVVHAIWSAAVAIDGDSHKLKFMSFSVPPPPPK